MIIKYNNNCGDSILEIDGMNMIENENDSIKTLKERDKKLLELLNILTLNRRDLKVFELMQIITMITNKNQLNNEPPYELNCTICGDFNYEIEVKL